MIPFEKTENGGGVPVEDLNAISRDPLSKSSSDIRDVARLRAKIDNNLNPIPATDDEAVDKTNEALRYCLLRWIAEIQDPSNTFHTNKESAVVPRLLLRSLCRMANHTQKISLKKS